MYVYHNTFLHTLTYINSIEILYCFYLENGNLNENDSILFTKTRMKMIDPRPAAKSN